MKRFLKIGLTGGICSGKTTVSELFSKYGIPIIDADRLSHQLVAPGTSGLQQVITVFGHKILQSDGQLDRKKMAQIIFVNERKRKQLECILHPLIYQAIKEEYQLISPKMAYSIVIVPLLVETKKYDEFDRVLVVDTPEHIQHQRAHLRADLDRHKVMAIMRHQATRIERLKRANDIIENDNNFDKLIVEVNRLHKYYLKISAGLTDRG